MSPKVQVLPLNYMCLRFLANRVIHALSDDEGLNCEILEKYLYISTYEVLEDLLRIILTSVNLDAGIRFSCIQVLLREDVKQLDTGIFPRFYWEQILITIKTKGKRLQYLNLKGVWVKDYPILLSELINNLQELKCLIVPHIVNDTVLSSLDGLNTLVTLDICGECSYSVEGLKKFKSNILQILNIGSYGKINICDQECSGIELVSELLLNFPNLTQLKTYSYAGSAIDLIYRKNPQYRTKLIYLHDTGTNLHIIQSIVKLCPNLESINLDSAEKNVLPKLSHLKKLHSLKLTKCDLADLLVLLDNCGVRFQIINVNNNNDSVLDLSKLCTLVPNLVTLACFRMRLTYRYPSSYFMELKNIELLYCDCTDTVVRMLLSNTPHLRRIVVGSEINMTDGDIFRLCAECEFRHLEELWFSNARCLTVTTVELLMSHCPALRLVGQLNGWDITKQELDYLKNITASTNIDLTLLPVGEFH